MDSNDKQLTLFVDDSSLDVDDSEFVLDAGNISLLLSYVNPLDASVTTLDDSVISPDEDVEHVEDLDMPQQEVLLSSVNPVDDSVTSLDDSVMAPDEDVEHVEDLDMPQQEAISDVQTDSEADRIRGEAGTRVSAIMDTQRRSERRTTRLLLESSSVEAVLHHLVKDVIPDEGRVEKLKCDNPASEDENDHSALCQGLAYHKSLKSSNVPVKEDLDLKQLGDKVIPVSKATPKKPASIIKLIGESKKIHNDWAAFFERKGVILSPAGPALANNMTIVVGQNCLGTLTRCNHFTGLKYLGESNLIK